MRLSEAGLVAAALAALVLGFAAGGAAGSPLTVYDVQYTTDLAGVSPQHGQIVDCTGGIVVHKFGGFKPKLTIQDPAFPDGWGGIQVKDWTVGHDLYDAVSVGDWITLSSVEVEDHRGQTLLHFKSANGAGFALAGTGQSLPAPVVVTPADLAAPVEGPPQEWYVADHGAEKYESMRVTVRDVAVTAMGLGKATDNYVLHGTAGDCWASDYMNADRGDLYHPYVGIGASFESVTGIVEQYTKDEFDYYQVLTGETADFVPGPAPLALLLAGGAALLSRRTPH